MDLAQSITTHYPKDWKSQIGHFNLLMTFTRAALPHEVTPKMTFTFVRPYRMVARNIWATVVSACPLPHCLVKKKKCKKAQAAIHSLSEKVDFTFTVSLFSVSVKRKERSIELWSFQSSDICALNYSIIALLIRAVENVIVHTKHTLYIAIFFSFYPGTSEVQVSYKCNIMHSCAKLKKTLSS